MFSFLLFFFWVFSIFFTREGPQSLVRRIPTTIVVGIADSNRYGPRMVVVNLLKGSTALLRTYGGGGCTSFRCQIKPNRNWDFLKWKNRPLSQSPLRVSLRSCKCTSAPIDSSSSSVIQETASSPAGAGDDVVDMSVTKDSANTLDMRVGVIVKAWRHEEADSLYVEEVDIGEPQPRIICSGLVNYVPLDHLQVYFLLLLFSLRPAMHANDYLAEIFASSSRFSSLWA